ncbi:MAG: hypothetical protein ACPG6V_10315 [Flavobacteriales bacterium]
MKVKNQNGQAFMIVPTVTPGVLYSGATYDGSVKLINNQIIDLDGYPKAFTDTPFRMLNGCFGNN